MYIPKLRDVSMVQVIFVRHAEVNLQVSDSLTKKGRGQAVALAERLKPYLEDKKVAFFTSPEVRTLETAGIIEAVVGLSSSAQEVQALLFGQREGFVQGVGRHCPDDVEVVLCVSRMGRAERLASELIGKQIFPYLVKGSNEQDVAKLMQENPDIVADLGYAEGVVVEMQSCEPGTARSYEVLRLDA
jgi:phosphohistidine phosphatase SixA